ncbi:MAG: polysaccharide biosynthesis tyrosine autokinase [Fibrobacteria bacterium]|nr:polysaccharide biosynthesis tyrosine autokinase [Fibrobacteria bacterium]
MNALRNRKELEFRDYYLILFQNKLLILFSIIVFTAPTWFILSRQPDYYDAHSQLSMDDSQENLMLTGNANPKNLGYYNGIFKGHAFQNMLINTIDTSIVPGITIEDKRKFLKVMLRISQGTYNSFLKIHCQTFSSDLSFTIVKTATDSLITFCRNVENQISQRTLQVIKEQIQTTAENYNDALSEKNKMSQQDSRGDIRGLNALEGAYESLLVEYELQNADLQAKKNYFRNLDKKVNKKTESPSKNRKRLLSELKSLSKERKKRIQLGLPLTDSLKSQQQDIEKQINSLKKSSPNNTSREISLINQWKSSRKDVQSAESALHYKRTKINALQNAIQNYKKEHPNIVKHEFESSRINELLDRYTNTHKRLTKRMEDEVINMQAQTGGLKIVEPPYKPTIPIKKNNMVFYIISVIVGLFIGVGLALFRNFLDDSIKSPEDIEKHLALPLLGTVPHIVLRRHDLQIKRATSEKSGRDIILKYPELILKGEQHKGIIDEAYRSIRTNLLFASPDKELQTFLISSSGPHEGKSLTAANTSLAFAQQGDPTLLIDGDLRRPTVHHLFKIDRGPGLGDLISGSLSIDEVTQSIEGSSLNILTAGTFLPNAAEVLGSNRFKTLLGELKQKFKYIIFDTPPILAVTDTCILSSILDGAVLISRAEKTSLHMLDRSVQSLKKVNANIFGCILNDVNLGKSRGYYGYYKNYYQYYHTTK